MTDSEAAWGRIKRNAGSEFHTTTGLAFTYRVPGDFFRVSRDGKKINRSLSKTSFRNAAEQMPLTSPAHLDGVQGPSYTWGILMDQRIRQGDWCDPCAGWASALKMRQATT